MTARAAGAGATQETAPTSLEEGGASSERASTADEPRDRADLSRLGSLLQTLQELRQRDPARYQRAVDSLARRLDDAAATRLDDESALFEGLARKLRQSGGAAAQPVAAGQGAACVQTSAGAPSTLEELVEASLEESAR